MEEKGIFQNMLQQIASEVQYRPPVAAVGTEEL